jgi:hypothetical protein
MLLQNVKCVGAPPPRTPSVHPRARSRRSSCCGSRSSHWSDGQRRRWLPLLQHLQRSEKSASADAEHGHRFAHRFNLLVQAQESLLLSASSFIALVAAKPRATRASRDAARRSFPSSSSSAAIEAMMLTTARPVGVLEVCGGVTAHQRSGSQGLSHRLAASKNRSSSCIAC